MKYRDRTTGIIYGQFELLQKYSNISFPQKWDDTTYNILNVDPVIIVTEPSCSELEKTIYEGVQYINGSWTDVWSVVPKYDDPVQQAAYEAQIIENNLAVKWETIRLGRNKLLSDTDYTQLPDTPITAQCRTAFQTYRQALRDVTSQPDPYNISWPTIPPYEKVP